MKPNRTVPSSPNSIQSNIFRHFVAVAPLDSIGQFIALDSAREPALEYIPAPRRVLLRQRDSSVLGDFQRLRGSSRPAIQIEGNRVGINSLSPLGNKICVLGISRRKARFRVAPELGHKFRLCVHIRRLRNLVRGYDIPAVKGVAVPCNSGEAGQLAAGIGVHHSGLAGQFNPNAKIGNAQCVAQKLAATVTVNFRDHAAVGVEHHHVAPFGLLCPVCPEVDQIRPGFRSRITQIGVQNRGRCNPLAACLGGIPAIKRILRTGDLRKCCSYASVIGQ